MPSQQGQNSEGGMSRYCVSKRCRFIFTITLANTILWQNNFVICKGKLKLNRPPSLKSVAMIPCKSSLFRLFSCNCMSWLFRSKWCRVVQFSKCLSGLLKSLFVCLLKINFQQVETVLSQHIGVMHTSGHWMCQMYKLNS